MVKKYSSKSAEITSVFLRQKNSKNDFRLKTTVHVILKQNFQNANQLIIGVITLQIRKQNLILQG